MTKYLTGHKSDVLRAALTCAISDRFGYLQELKDAKKGSKGETDEWLDNLIEETKAEIKDFQKLYASYY